MTETSFGLSRHLHWTIESGPNVSVIHLVGELDMILAASFDEMVVSAATAPVVVVDVSEVQFMAVAGITALLRLKRAVTDGTARQFRLRTPSRAVTRVLDACRANDLFEIEY